jgi:hypothetical protein
VLEYIRCLALDSAPCCAYILSPHLPQTHRIETSMKYTFTVAVVALCLDTAVATPLNVEARQGVGKTIPTLQLH